MLKATASLLVLCALIVMSSASGMARSTPAAQTQDSAQPSTTQPQQLKVTAYTLPPEKLARAEALYTIRTVLYLFGMAFGIVVLWIILKLRVAPLFRNLAERAGNNTFLQALVFVPLLTLLLAVVSLPIDIYHHHISLAYGLSVQGWGSWAFDWCKAEAVALVIFVPTVWVLFRIIRKSPERWWFYSWLLTLPFIVLLIFVAPVILDPMFNTFEPLQNTQPELVSAIEKEI